MLNEKKNNHISHQGPSNDKTKEYTQAKDRGIHIVSPHWLYSCQEKNERVDETMYPHTFNPKLSLPVVTTGRRMTRSSRAVSIVVYKPCLVQAPAAILDLVLERFLIECRKILAKVIITANPKENWN